MRQIPKIKPMGEQAILLEFEPEINADLLDKLLFLKNFIKEKLVKEEVEITNTYSSILISYKYAIEDVYGEISQLEKLLWNANIEKNTQKGIYRIPVCYHPKFGLDLEQLSAVKNLTVKELMRLHTLPVYTVYFVGFLPGFLYLGGLDEKLHFPRKDQPRLKVEKGAVGIGDKQTGIYPQTSPGGWQIIGNSPVPLFDINQERPCEISAGSKLKFYAVDLKEYEMISEDVRKGNFKWEKEIYND